ncbi:MAG: DUF374 domain-containing protein [Deltaproteobacteria bacterium]|nr:DUF374 domain-containing protein [Deltaproteobacteria bacterium]
MPLFLKMKSFFPMLIAYYILRLYFLTIRIKSINEDALLQHLNSGNKIIAAIWHQRIIAVLGYVKRFSAYRPSVMISKSRDGDLIAAIYSRFNFRPIRGSSSRDGKKALSALVDDLKDHPFAVHVLDGPRGPRGIVKPGLIVLAEQSGVPIVPAYVSMSRAWKLNSWDGCLIPKPFSKIVIRWGQPRAITREIDEQCFEDARKDIETHMLENQRQDDLRFGWKDLI